jgi:hypothetical protein
VIAYKLFKLRKNGAVSIWLEWGEKGRVLSKTYSTGDEEYLDSIMRGLTLTMYEPTQEKELNNG